MANAQPLTTSLEPSDGADLDVAPSNQAGGWIPTEGKRQPPPPSDVGAVGGAPASNGANIMDSVRSRQHQKERGQKGSSNPTAASQGNGSTAGASADTGGPEFSPPIPVTDVMADTGKTPPPKSSVTEDLGTTGSRPAQVTQGIGDMTIHPSGATAGTGGPEFFLPIPVTDVMANTGTTPPPVSSVTEDLGTTGSRPAQIKSMEEVTQGIGDMTIHPSGATADTGGPESSLPIPVTDVMADTGKTPSPVSLVTEDLGTTGSRPAQIKSMEESGDYDVRPGPAHELDNLISDILMHCYSWLQAFQARYSKDVDLAKKRLLRVDPTREKRLQEDMETYWSWVSQEPIALLYSGTIDSSTMRPEQAVFMFRRMLAIMIVLHFLAFAKCSSK